MSHVYPDIQIKRIEEAHNRLAREAIIDRIPLTAQFAVTPEPIPYADRESLSYKPITCGEKWGDAWDCGWFHIQGVIPDDWAGSYITLNLDFTGEALLYDADGCPRSALTTGSIFDNCFFKDTVHFSPACTGGEMVDFWIETGANYLNGTKLDKDPVFKDDPECIYGKYPASITKLHICKFDYDKWQLWLDLHIVLNLIKDLPSTTARRMQLIRQTTKALDSLPPERGGATTVREAMRKIFGLGIDPATVKINGIGHAHIDTAYLWPIRETIRKVGRTFANQVDLINRYPGYKFGASQPQLYAYCKEHYPKLYEKVKTAVAAESWELQGGMWVEADCNIPNGESLIRQILIGRNFYKDEFGVEVKNVWIPDVFGYSANLPQIIKTAGIDYFLTQKISWNRYNVFPHNTFLWQGIDGSTVLAHFPPEDNYNAEVIPSQLRKHETNNAEAGLIEDAISLYGIGNGGGGPKEEHIEQGLRCHNLNGCPQFNFAFAQPALERMAHHREDLATWVGELYLEMHRGTYTSQAAMKRWNRRAEEALRAAEMLCASASLNDYPTAEFDRLWKTLLTNQFHDIIPGSSVNRVYREAVPQLLAIIDECKRLQNTAASTFLSDAPDTITFFNPSSTPFAGVRTLPHGWTGGSVNTLPLATQCEGDDVVAWIEIPPQSFVTVTRNSTSCGSVTTLQHNAEIMLENDAVRYVLNAQMQVISCYDKQLEFELISKENPGNTISLYDDHPSQYDAWDIEEYVYGMKTHSPEIISLEAIFGPVRTGVKAVFKLNESTFTQTAWLNGRGKRLDFVTHVDWNENHKYAQVEFPVNVSATEASFETQYGIVTRPTHDNTKWQYAQFEVAGQRFADLSEPNHGVALINDSKYGYRVKGNVLALSLLRAPTYPDANCDRGEHEFTYSILPHAGTLASTDEVATHAAIINQGVEKFVGKKTTDKTKLPISCVGEGIELSVIKKAEKENCLIVRLAERRGSRAKGTLTSALEGITFVECHTSEWDTLGEPLTSPATLSFRPFEIKTFKVTTTPLIPNFH